MFSRRDTLKISLALSAMGLSAAPAFAWKTGEPEEKISCDILVVGSGIAGTVAALQAVEDGAKVLMIDKASENQRGGNSRVCLGDFSQVCERSSQWCELRYSQVQTAH